MARSCLTWCSVHAWDVPELGSRAMVTSPPSGNAASFSAGYRFNTVMTLDVSKAAKRSVKKKKGKQGTSGKTGKREQPGANTATNRMWCGFQQRVTPVSGKGAKDVLYVAACKWNIVQEIQCLRQKWVMNARKGSLCRVHQSALARDQTASS